MRYSPWGTLVGNVVISLNMQTMNWQHSYNYTQILSVAKTGALTGPYGTNVAKDGHDSANSYISSTAVSRRLLPRPTARSHTHTRKQQTWNFCEIIIMPNAPSLRDDTAQAADGLQMRVYCVPSRGQRTVQTHITYLMQYVSMGSLELSAERKSREEICSSVVGRLHSQAHCQTLQEWETYGTG